MKMKNLSKVIARSKMGLMILAVLVIASCDSCGDDPWCEITTNQLEVSNLESYLDKINSKQESTGLDTKSIDLYIDLSDGMAPAWNVETNKEIFQKIIIRTQDYNPNYFTMGRDKKGKKYEADIDFLKEQGRIAEGLMMPEKESDLIYAQINPSLKTLVQNNHEAIFISDFEEYLELRAQPLKVASTAIYGESFLQWINSGHNLYIYRLPYTDNEKKKNLIIAMFLSSDSQSNGNIVRSRLFKEHNLQPDIVFDHNPFSIHYEDSIANSKSPAGTVAEEYDIKENSVWNNWSTDGNQEIIPLSWHFSEYINSYGGQLNGKVAEGLLLDNSSPEYFKITEIDAITFDITNDLQLNTKINHLENIKSQIEMEQNQFGDSVWTASSINSLLCLNEGFDTNSYNIKSEFSAAKFSPVSVSDVFELDQEIFSQWNGDQAATPLNLRYNENKIAKNEPNEGYCWATYITIQDLEIDNEKFKDFDFIDPENNLNSSLSQSLYNVAINRKKQILENENILYKYYFLINNE